MNGESSLAAGYRPREQNENINGWYCDLNAGFEPNCAYKMVGATIAAIPMLLVFMLFQRFFTNAITTGAVKE